MSIMVCRRSLHSNSKTMRNLGAGAQPYLVVSSNYVTIFLVSIDEQHASVIINVEDNRRFGVMENGSSRRNISLLGHLS